MPYPPGPFYPSSRSEKRGLPTPAKQIFYTSFFSPFLPSKSNKTGSPTRYARFSQGETASRRRCAAIRLSGRNDNANKAASTTQSQSFRFFSACLHSCVPRREPKNTTPERNSTADAIQNQSRSKSCLVRKTPVKLTRSSICNVGKSFAASIPSP